MAVLFVGVRRSGMICPQLYEAVGRLGRIAVTCEMGPRNRVFRSPDPLDYLGGESSLRDLPPDASKEDRLRWALDRIEAQFGDPLDQANEKTPMRTHHSNGFDVRALRDRLGVTQRMFAALFGFPVATLRHWERGNRKPTGTALVLLHVIRENPRVVRKAVNNVRARLGRPLAPIEPRKSFRAPPGLTQDPYVLIRRARRSWYR